MSGTAQFQTNLDTIWILVAAGLVLLMQIGFMLLEAGTVRTRNSINVAQKNLLDFTFSAFAFAVVGFMFAFGNATGWLVGFDTDLLFLKGLDDENKAFFVFQVMFCGTAATIVSGAIAERMRLSAYILCAVFTAVVIYPIFAHWAWGAVLGSSNDAFLANMGFMDFAGSTVVHGTGAWIALAACIVLGPRIGKYDKDSKPIRLQGNNPVLATVGGLLLLVGWLGFNGGSTFAANNQVSHIVTNTILAAASGGIAGYFLGWYQDRVIFPEKTISSMLGGLVAVTAGCMALDVTGAIVIGIAGGCTAIISARVLEVYFRIDDPVSAIGVHGFAGIVGTIGVALLAPVDQLAAGGRLEQFWIQALGVSLNFIWAFGLGILFFSLLVSFMQVRVRNEEEKQGLNSTDHGTHFGLESVEDAFSSLAKGTADLDMRLQVEPGGDAEQLTRAFNRLIGNIQKEERERHQQADEIRNEEEAERLSALANATFEAIIISKNGIIVDGNVALQRLLGLPIEEIRGSTLFEFVDNDYVDFVKAQLGKAETPPYEIRVKHISGEIIPVEVRAREIMHRGEMRRVSAVVDLRERKAAEEQIRYLAQHDPLTGLPNRAVFTSSLTEAIEQASVVKAQKSLVAVFLLDLDRFKDINDAYGHAAGDHVLTVTADRLRSVIGDNEMVARLGGDEFALIASKLNSEADVIKLAVKLLKLISQPIDGNDGLVFHAGVSIGASICPTHSTDPEVLTLQADTALYKAKSSGRNLYCLFENGMDNDARARRSIEADLTEAIEKQEFELFFQPRMCSSKRKITGYEALVRWNHPVKGIVPPGDFISVAEETGKIIPIGDWVLRTACRIAIKHFPSINVSVNVSTVQFRERNFIRTLQDILTETGMPPERLEIEITESVLVDDDERALEILERIKGIGVRVALDDFGTGYSSLGYLSRFPFDAIKIDRSFVRAIYSTENALAIVSTIVGLGKALGMTIVAEGVETKQELSLLVGEGCDEIQGFFVGEPMPIDGLQTQIPEIVLDTLSSKQLSSDTLIDQLKTAAGKLKSPDTVPTSKKEKLAS
ncbi:MAG: ammonium transporter [Hyphomicrobiales bacterium]